MFLCTTVNAQKYWVGGSGVWNDTNHWSSTDGGENGVNPPGKDENAFFTNKSGFNQGDIISIDSVAFVSNLDFSYLDKQVTIEGPESSHLMITGNVVFNGKVTNNYGGNVMMVGSNSDYQLKVFKPGEFNGKTVFSDVYKKKKGVSTLAVTAINSVVTDATCGDNGSIVVTPLDGTGPFSYSWFATGFTGQGTNTYSDLKVGLYNVVVTDLSDFQSTPFSNIEVKGPSPLTIQHLITDSVNCNGGSDGFIATLVFGGVAPYTILWDDPGAQSTATATGLSIGDYSIQVTDDVGCVANIGPITVEEPTVLTSSITDTTHVSCFTVCDGDATVAAAGGTAGYLYDWYDAPDGDTDVQTENLCAGTYHVEITDSRGCLDTSEVIITEPTELEASIATYTDVQCFGDGDGTANAAVTGGTPIYTYDWYNVGSGPTIPNINSLSPGTYNVEVKDANGCLDTAEVIIIQPTLLTSSITDTVHVLCNSLCTGEIEVTAAGGSVGYTYLWYDAASETTDRVTNMCAGSYNVRVEDANGCRDTSSVTLLQPATAITTSITDTTHNLCFEDCDGEAIVTPVGGSPGYTFDWYDLPGGNTDSTASNLCEGTYNVEVTDANGCSDTSEVIITEPTVLSGTTTLTMVDCKSNCNGEIDLTPTGGTTAYTFDWYDVLTTPTTEDITGLCDGTYHVEITDANGCLDTIEAVITEPDTLVASITSSTNVLCNGVCSGSATVDQVGGVGPYSIDWYDLALTPTTATVNNVCAGVYNVEITDANGCLDTIDVTITEPALALSSSITDTVHIQCKNVCSGEAEVTAAGGVGGYLYDWYDAPGAPSVIRALNLCDGTYNVEITDANGCLDTSVVTITEPATSVTIDVNDSLNATCNGLCNGEAFATYSGGSAGYTLDWYTAANQTTDSAFNLCAGVHFVEITDANGCLDTASIIIDEPAPMVITINSATLPTCFGDCDGIMSVTPSGGTSPYLYSWYDVGGGPTTPSVSGQCAGGYNVRVEDAQGCIDTALVILSEPDSLEHTIDSQTNLLCKNTCDGAASMTPIGGTAGYTVTWYDVPTSPTGTSISDLCAGTWNFELEDANGCLDSGTVTLTEPALELTSSITDTTHNLCFGECNGDATVTSIGGTGLLTYDWYNSPDSDTDIQAENLCAGTYNVETSDANGCLDTAEVTIIEPLDIAYTTAVQNLNCGAVSDGLASVSVTGGLPPYSYDWYDAGNQTNDTASGLLAGTYHCEITDANGCLDTAEVILTSPTPLVASIRNDTIHIDCFGNCNGQAYMDRTGGIQGPGYLYSWYDAPGSPITRTVSGLCAGVYHGEVTDANGCKDTAEFEIREPTLLISSADSIEASCFGVCDGKVWTDYSGGTSPYVLDWYNVPGNPSTDTVSSMCTGSFNVEITDANGCKDTANVGVTAPVVVTSSITDTTHNICAYNCSGEAIVTPVGGSTPYSYDWYDIPGGDTDSTGSNLCVGTFHVEVSDNNGCLDTSEVTINSVSPPLTTETDSILTSCVGLSDGSAIVVPSGGQGPYSIDWFENGNQITDTITGLAAGTYKVEVTDANGCIDTVEAIVNDPPVLIAAISDTTHVLCFDDSSGIAIVTPIGGTPGFTYNWYDAVGVNTDSTVSNLPDGTFHVEVTDANGCLDTGIVTITEAPIIVLGSDSIEATCTGICTGAAIVVASGGVGPYTFDWYDAGNQTNDTASSICAGSYHAEVTDANGCIDTVEVVVTEPVTITASAVDSMATTCNGGNNGWAAVSGSGGTLPYTYWWSDALNQTNDTVQNVIAGLYQGAVTDVNGCSDTIEINVLEPLPISPNDSLVTISCNGICDGYISLNVTGGTSGYSHSWNTGSTDTLISNLCPGSYSDTITDAAGCIDTFSFVITEPDSLKAPITDTIHVTCSYSSDGQAIVTPTGGTTDYTYDWYDAGNDADSVASGLLPGTYHVEVTDANGCVDTGVVTINSASAIVMVTDSVEATCSGICNGIALVNVSGGSGPYTYDWYTAGNIDNDSIINICADTFNVAVVDGNGCRDTAIAIVTQPVSVVASISDTSDVVCYEGTDGWATVSGLGGTLPYSFWWSDGSANDTIFDLSAGLYRAAVIDINGCSDTVDITINEPDAWDHTVDSIHASCYTYCDGQVTITPDGGTGPYSHSWNTGSTNATIINLCPTAYFDTITDANGCRDTVQVVISQPDSLEARPLIINNVLCFGDSTSRVRALGNGGTAPYSFDWGGGQVNASGDTAVGFGVGNNQVILTDSRGCIDTNVFVITEPSLLTSSITDTLHANCVCNATAIVTPVGGTSGYTFLWNDLAGTTDSTANGLCTGSYQVEVTDANGCVDTSEVTIRDTSVFTISITDTIHASCFGKCDGEAIVTPSLGTLPYDYAWTDPGLTTDSLVDSLCAGNVSVTVTDGEGCIRFANVTIQEPNSINSTPMFTSPSCFGDTNAVVWVDVTGGTAPYMHSWDTTSVNDTVYNVGIGTYTDTITDGNGCFDTVQVTVTEPLVLGVNIDSSNVVCNGNGDGSAWSVPSGGTSPYSYVWNNLETTDTIQNLAPGNYMVVVSDFNGCTDSDSVAIVEPLLLTSSITDTSHVSCLCTGVSVVTPIGGTGPYSYLWNDPLGQTDSTATGLCAGNYLVEVTDANGCTDTSYVTIRDTSNFITSIVDTNMVTCNSLCNGSAKARAENGVQPYVFTWNDPGVTSDSLVTGLCAGNYTVTIQDAIGCTHNLNVTITEPNAISFASVDTSVSCNTLCDGSIETTISGGTAPYSVLWDDPNATDSVYVDSLCAGDYILTVTDSLACTAKDTVTITEPAELVAFISPFSHVSCFGSNNGAATALGTGGTTPYSYVWSDASLTQTISNKGPGLISVMITDTNGCQDDTSLTILEPTLLASSITDTTHVLCGGASTGEAIVTPTGGTLPYSYDWYDAPGSIADSTASNLPAGTYHVEIVDANGCRDTSEVIITEPSLFTASITSQTTTSCLVCDGDAFVTPNGGISPYTYDWYNVTGTPTDSFATGLCASIKNVLVTDANGCQVDVQVVTTGPGGLTAGVFDSTMVTCNGLCDGIAVSTGIAGTAPYTYTWDDPAVTLNDSVENLCIGTYNVEVEDAAGCLAYASVTITQPDPLIATVSDTNATGCFSPCSGDATVSAIGGTGSYSYGWDDWASQSTATATGLCAAQYIATVTDANGCQDTAIGFITGPGGLTVAVDSVIDIKCFGSCDGNTAITAMGGTGAYSYLWTDPSGTTDSVVSGLCAGTFNGQVTDGNGCVAFANVTIIEPTELIVAMSDSSDALCNSGNEGWGLVSYSGGTAPYVVQWNDAASQTTDTAKGLTAGTYTVTVTDANGCFKQVSVTIDQPSPISVNVSNVQHVACTGFCIGQATLAVSGGTVGSGYNYLWQPTGQTSPAAINLCSGFQTYTVTDANGCTVVDSVEILDLNNFSSALTGTSVSCNGDCNGTVLSTPTGGTAPYQHEWTNGNTSDAQNNLCPGMYIDTVFDANGCFFVDSFEVQEPTLFEVEIDDSLNLKCFNICDGFAVANGSGGTTPYQYTWYNSPGAQVNDTAYNLCAATYFVQGEDANGCISEDTITLTQPAGISTSIDAQTNVTCAGACNGSATISATGGVGTLDFLWPDASTLTSRTNLCADAYAITVTDDSSCTATINLNLTEPDSLKAIITDTTHIVCSTVCDGDATVGQTGGTAPFTYDWYDAGNLTTAQITNQCVGTYHVEIEDANGCLDTAVASINDINILNGSIATTNISCNGLCDGKLVANPSGGVGPYTYSWNTGGSIDSITDLCQNNYFVTITDNNLCQVAVAASIIEPSKLTSSIVDSMNLDCYQVCDGYATVSPSGGTSPYTYLWNDPAAQTGITATGLCAQTFKVVVTDNNGCQDSSYAFISEPSDITTTIVPTQANCTNTSDGSIDLTSNGGTGLHTYSWTDTATFTSTDEDPTNLAIGSYFVTVTDGNGCTHLDTTVISEVNIVNADAGNDTTICDQDSVLLIGQGGSSYSWSIGSNNDSIKVAPSLTTDYILTVLNNGCSDQDTVTINVNALPNLSAIANDYLILEGNTTTLTVTGAGVGANYDWNPPLSLNDPTTATPIASPTATTNYIVTGTDVNGCMDTASVQIIVATSIVFPDGITPNGDGLNDTWRIELIEEFPDNVVQVYNRWGQMVFESKGYLEQWDGLHNGKELPVGTYYFLIDLGNDMPKYTGPITLMR